MSDSIYSREKAAGVDIKTLNGLRLFLGGAGNTGSHFVERAIRNMIKHLYVIDFDKEGYQAHNFPHSSILLDHLADEGKPKAETLAMRANEKLLSGGKYIGKTIDIRDIGPEIVSKFDMVLGFFDNIDARSYLYTIAREANVPFMEIGLSEKGDWQLQIRDHSPEEACYCCSLGQKPLAQSCSYTYQDDVSMGIAPTTDVAGAEAAACAMHAIMRYFSGEGFPSNVKFRFDSESFSIEKLVGTKNPNCSVCSFETVDKKDLIHLSGSVDEMTYREFEQRAEQATGKKLKVCLTDRFVIKDYCPKCGKEKTFMNPEHRIKMSDVVCEECHDTPGEEFLSRHVMAKQDWLDGLDEIPETLKDITMYDFGFAYGSHILAVDENYDSYFFTLDGDLKLISEFMEMEED